MKSVVLVTVHFISEGVVRSCCHACAQAADEMQGLPQPDVESHQQHYVRYRSWQEGVLLQQA